MKLSTVFPEQRPVVPVDASDLASLTSRMFALSDEINALAVNVAQAKAIREFSGDRTKRALANHMRGDLLRDVSAAKAEALSRSSDGYGKELDQLQLDLQAAETVLAQHAAKLAAFDACRTAISALKRAADTY